MRVIFKNTSLEFQTAQSATKTTLSPLSIQSAMYCYSDGTFKLGSSYTQYKTYIYNVTDVDTVEISGAAAISSVSGVIGNVSAVSAGNIENISVNHDWATESTGSGTFKGYFSNGVTIISTAYSGSAIDSVEAEEHSISHENSRNILLVHAKAANAAPVVKSVSYES